MNNINLKKTSFVARLEQILPKKEWQKIILASLIIFLLAFSLYFNTLHHDFLKDDFRLIVENHRIKSFDAFIDSIDGKFFAFPDFPYLHYWRPLTLFTFFIDYKLWGLNPAGFHFTNILLNALNGLLIFLIFYRLSRTYLLPFAAAAFFSLHPSHVEAVSWVSGRTDLLAAFFIFTAILCFILFLEKKRPLYYVLTAAAFILGLLSKENAALFPLAAAGLIYIARYSFPQTLSPIEGKNKIENTENTFINKLGGFLPLVPLIAVETVYIFIHNSFSGVSEVAGKFSFGDIGVTIKTIGVYVRVIFAPYFPAPYFSMHHFDADRYLYIFLALVAAAILVLIVVRKRDYVYSRYALVFFIFLIPVLNPEMVPSYPKIVIRFAYIPAVFAGVFFIETVRMILKRASAEEKPLVSNTMRTVLILLMIVTAVVWTVDSYRFQVFFKNRPNHYQRLVEDFPDDGTLLLPLALYKAEKKQYDEAMKLASHALEVNQNDRWLDVSELAALLRANIMVVTGKREAGKSIAESILKKTTRKETEYFCRLILAKYYEKEKDYTTSFNMLKKAEAFGQPPDLLFRLAIASAKMKDYDQALQYLEKTKKANPEIKGYSQLKKLFRDAKKITETNKTNNIKNTTNKTSGNKQVNQ